MLGGVLEIRRRQPTQCARKESRADEEHDRDCELNCNETTRTSCDSSMSCSCSAASAAAPVTWSDLPNAQLAVPPGTTHVATAEKTDWLDGRRVAGASSRYV